MLVVQIYNLDCFLQVTQVNEAEVTASIPYLLFYQRNLGFTTGITLNRDTIPGMNRALNCWLLSGIPVHFILV